MVSRVRDMKLGLQRDFIVSDDRLWPQDSGKAEYKINEGKKFKALRIHIVRKIIPISTKQANKQKKTRQDKYWSEWVWAKV